MNALIIVATAGEAQRLSDLPARVIVSGVGPVAAALATQRALMAGNFHLVISAGIGGAYPNSGLQPGDLAMSSAIIQADLGAWDGGHFLDFAALGLSILPDGQQDAQFPSWNGAAEAARRAGAAFGPMLTLCSVTGAQKTARHLENRYPGALTEGMEGAGVAHAALLTGIPVIEVRGISNMVGPRDRASWRIPAALEATRRGVEIVLQMADGG